MGSRTVSTNQVGVHPDLERVHRRHVGAEYRRKISDHSRQSFAAVETWLAGRGRPLILDSGCGTGMSTALLAGRFPTADVIGVDRSAVRLSKGEAHGSQPENMLTVRADLIDFWRLAHAQSWHLERHYILYPNPYPKSDQLKRRWHAHPVLPQLLGLGGALELRSNWRTYLEEFAAVLTLCGCSRVGVQLFQAQEFLSLFEKKYAESGQHLWQLRVQL